MSACRLTPRCTGHRPVCFEPRVDSGAVFSFNNVSRIRTASGAGELRIRWADDTHHLMSRPGC